MFYSLSALLSYFQISLILLDEISSCPALTATHKISSLPISPKFAMTAYMIRLSGLERFTEATIDVWPVHSGQSHPFNKQKQE